ncbi:MAG TPA: hypothetical protein VME70_11490 [Mycobacteriales bacterium]|nr:hypothetical protein [Mycobacteriales bacterium]
MRRRDDDLTAWSDDPVVRALTAPGTDSELAGEEMALAAFRATAQPRTRRRFAGRLGVGGSALTVAIAFSGGVAAAYTAALPTSVQHVMNVVGGWAGIPAPTHSSHGHAGHHNKHGSSGSGQQGAATVPTTAIPVPSSANPQPTTSASHHAAPKPAGRSKSSPPAGASSPPASTSPAPTPTSTPTPTPTPTLSTPVPASITITLSATKVAVGGSVSVVGHLATSSGAPVAGHRIWLIERLPGQSTVAEVDSGLTGADGSVTLTASDLTQSVRLRLLAGGGVRSAPVLVVVLPTLGVATSPAGSSYVVTVTATGAEAGDPVLLQRRTAAGWVAVTQTQVDSTGGAEFSVPIPQRAIRYRVILPRTSAHGFAVARFTALPS